MNDLSLNTSEGTSQEMSIAEPQGQYLTFLVAEDTLGIAIKDVKEIIEISHITPVPMTPESIRGVINLRGNVVPVVDLSARLGHNISEISKRSCIVLVEIHGVADKQDADNKQNLGMLVDQVQEILEIASQNIQPAPTFGCDIRVEFIQAMGRVEEEFIILLDITRVLSIAELAELSQVVEENEASLLEVKY